MITNYTVQATSTPGGEGTLHVFDQRIRFDAGAERDLTHAGPAELMCSALAACLLKNLERFAGILPFDYRAARVTVTATREASPPRFSSFSYRIELVSTEPARRVALLHRNLKQHGTVGGTLAQAAEVYGEIHLVEHLHD